MPIPAKRASFSGHPSPVSEKAEQWYAERISSRSDLDNDLSLIEEPVHLENLTQEDLDRSDRFLRITPAKRGSGLSDVSMEHDKYLYEDG